jgi:hypothetical protein
VIFSDILILSQLPSTFDSELRIQEFIFIFVKGKNKKISRKQEKYNGI